MPDHGPRATVKAARVRRAIEAHPFSAHARVTVGERAVQGAGVRTAVEVARIT